MKWFLICMLKLTMRRIFRQYVSNPSRLELQVYTAVSINMLFITATAAFLWQPGENLARNHLLLR